MKLIQQKNKHDCVPTSLLMLSNGISYKKIKNYCKKHFGYRPNKGCTITNETACQHFSNLGINAVLYEVNNKTLEGHTKYNKALILTHNDRGGHCIAWDGARCFDPNIKKPYSEFALDRDMYFTIFVIKTSYIKRIFNMITKQFYDFSYFCITDYKKITFFLSCILLGKKKTLLLK